MLSSSEFTLVVLFGGISSEHEASVGMFDYFRSEVSIKGSTFKSIESYYLDRNGDVLFLDTLDKVDIDSGNVRIKNRVEITRAELCLELSKENLFIHSLLQGQEGEDGIIQGVLEFLGARGNAGSVAPSLLSINKFAFNVLARSHIQRLGNIRSALVNVNTQRDKIVCMLADFEHSKVIIRPNTQGASVLTEVFEKDDVEGILRHCIEISQMGDQALIQEFIAGEEVTCGCLKKNGSWVATRCYVVSSVSGFMGKAEKTGEQPYKIVRLQDDKLEKAIQEICVLLSRIFDFHTQCRYDLIWDGKIIFLLECNSKPGLLETSIYPKMLLEAGIGILDLLDITFQNEMNRREARALSVHIDPLDEPK